MIATLTIDLPAIVANWRDLAARGAPGAVAGVVKADGYGLGAAEIGRALRAAGCRHFFVALLAEGVALRSAIGPGPMIGVLGGFAPGADGDAALTPVLNSLGDVTAHAAAGRAAGVGRRAILHVDTGMARLGLDAKELALISADHGMLAGLDLHYVMTHLACADEPAHPMNAAQAARFAAACAGLPRLRRSFANSSGLFLGPGFASDLARPGCALYGINPTPGHPNPMRPVMRLEAPVLQVREILAGTPVGYGGTWTAPRPTRIATVAVGYADGYLRSLSGRAVAEFRGRSVPLVARVSMDLTTFDVTDLPEIGPGDRLTLIGGDGCSPDEVGARAGTIGYEVLTSLGARYARDYLRG
ncbi:alanine racemase [Roseomonas sp. CAU 1739]|uniref:alanine racemase n=1 Tax=Roseomonas sp. CAU 1739 TaxID=3140364 RepID=UPI00325B8674